jgi:hypothetical protein
MHEPESRQRFPGFQQGYSKNFFTYPNMLEEYWYDLSGSEQKVLDFILRQTLGFKKRCDFIALSQFSEGIGGRSRNKGTGLSVSQVRRAITKLEDKGFIVVTRIRNCPSSFCLALENDPAAFLDDNTKKVLILPRMSKKR